MFYSYVHLHLNKKVLGFILYLAWICGYNLIVVLTVMTIPEALPTYGV